jgi:HAD superfamily hydrolase (TIGR01509 family)
VDPKYRCVFFDFDGVLVRSAHIKNQTFLKAAQVLAPHLTAELEDALFGELAGAERKTISTWIFEKTQGAISARSFLNLFTKLIDDEAVTVDPEAIDLLDRLGKAQVQTAIVSAAPKQSILGILKQSHCPLSSFHGIFGSEMGPKEGSLSFLLQDLGLSPDETVMVGDMPSDLKAAHACSIPFIRFEGEQSHLASWPKEYQTDRVRNFRELENFLF